MVNGTSYLIIPAAVEVALEAGRRGDWENMRRTFNFLFNEYSEVKMVCLR